MRLRHIRPLLALTLAFAPTLAPAAEPAVTHTKAGAWQSTDFRDPANPGCSIGGPGSMPGGRLIMGANRARPDPMNLIIRKTGWAIPEGTPVQVQAAFPDGSVMRFAGRGKGPAIEIEVPAAMMRDWVHGLTASAAMQLSFGGTEPPWVFDLAGTTQVINAMGDCFRSHGIFGVAPPFGGTEASTQPFGTPGGTVGSTPGGTQPFGAAPPGNPDAGGPVKRRFGAAAVTEPDPDAPAPAGPRAASAEPPPRVAADAPPDAGMPPDQAAFLAAVEAARRTFRAAGDDVGRASARPARAQALCRAVPQPVVSGWAGTVAAVGTSAEGRGTLAVRLAPGVTARTWGDAASDYGDGTLLDPASPLGRAVSALRPGQRVRFSATLIEDRTDCVREAGTSLAGSVLTPEFIMRLDAVQASP